MIKKTDCNFVGVIRDGNLVRLGFTILVLCSITISVPYAHAQATLEATARLEYIENPRRNTISSDEELLSQVSVGGSYARQTGRFTSSLNYVATKMDYKNNTLADRDLISGNGNITWNIKPDLFSWRLANSRTFQAFDTSLPDTTDNRQIVNTISTGPALTIPLGSVNRLNIQYDYSIADYEQIDSYSQVREAVDMNFLHVFSSALTGSIKAGTLDAEFDIGDAFNFQRNYYSVQGEFKRENYDVTLEFGWNEIERQLVGSRDSPLVKVDANLQLNTRSSLSASFSKSLEDILSNIQLLGSQPNGIFGDRVANSNQNQSYELTSTALSYTYTLPSSVQASLSYLRLSRDFPRLLLSSNESNEQEDELVTLQLTWPLRPNLDITVLGRRSNLFFSQNERNQSRNQVGIMGNYRISETFSFQFSIMQTRQSGNILFDNYDGLNSYISLTYRH